MNGIIVYFTHQIVSVVEMISLWRFLIFLNGFWWKFEKYIFHRNDHVQSFTLLDKKLSKHFSTFVYIFSSLTHLLLFSFKIIQISIQYFSIHFSYVHLTKWSINCKSVFSYFVQIFHYTIYAKSINTTKALIYNETTKKTWTLIAEARLATRIPLIDLMKFMTSVFRTLPICLTPLKRLHNLIGVTKSLGVQQRPHPTGGC